MRSVTSDNHERWPREVPIAIYRMEDEYEVRLKSESLILQARLNTKYVYDIMKLILI
jgi:hypothetical protein